MAVTQAEVLNLFSQIGAVANNDNFLLYKANANGTMTAAKVTAQVLRAYLSAGFVVTIGEDGYFYIGGVKTSAEARVDMKVVNQTLTNVEINPNCLNRWQTPVNALSVTFSPGYSDTVNEYMLEFTVNSSTFTLSLPVDTVWMNDEEPDWTPDDTYHVSILNGMAIGAAWPVPLSSSSSSSS